MTPRQLIVAGDGPQTVSSQRRGLSREERREKTENAVNVGSLARDVWCGAVESVHEHEQEQAGKFRGFMDL